jgi:hypothetical protein
VKCCCSPKAIGVESRGRVESRIRSAKVAAGSLHTRIKLRVVGVKRSRHLEICFGTIYDRHSSQHINLVIVEMDV